MAHVLNGGGGEQLGPKRSFNDGDRELQASGNNKQRDFDKNLLIS